MKVEKYSPEQISSAWVGYHEHPIPTSMVSTQDYEALLKRCKSAEEIVAIYKRTLNHPPAPCCCAICTHERKYPDPLEDV
jgi:hypothetical protein